MDQEMNKEVMMDDFFKSVLQGIDIENELVMWSNEKLADLLTTYIWADIDLNSPKSAVLSVAIERLKATRLTAADALAEGIKRALEDKRLTALFDAVDDYLCGKVIGEGYPEGHTNPEHLMALRTAFLRASSNRAGGTGEVILKTALQQWREATDA